MVLDRFSKIVTILIVLFLVYGCQTNNYLGQWESIIEDDQGNKVKTNLTLTGSFEDYSGKMISSIEGEETDELNLKKKEIDFSGTVYSYSDELNITDVSDNDDDYFYGNKSLKLSKDKKTLTLSPGNIKFKKK